MLAKLKTFSLVGIEATPGVRPTLDINALAGGIRMAPAAISNRRSSTRWGWLSCSKLAVTRPVAVRGSIDTGQVEMVAPAVAARMKKRHDGPRFGIDRRQVASLVPIANRTGQGQVIGRRMTAVFFGHNMVDGMGGQRNRFGDQTVFTAFDGPLPVPGGGVLPECGSCSWDAFSRELQGRLGLGECHGVLDILILLPFDPLRFGKAAVSVLGRRTSMRCWRAEEGRSANTSLGDGKRRRTSRTSASPAKPPEPASISRNRVPEFAANDR